jgi:hypothetical protein
MKTFPILALLLTCLLGSGLVRATEYVFSNPDGGSWQTAANWTPNGVPGPGDRAIVAGTADYAVTLAAGVEVGSLVVGGQTGSQSLQVVGFALAVQTNAIVTAGGSVRLFNSSLSGDWEVTADGLLVTAGSTLTTGAISVAFNGRLELAACVFASFNLQNFGTVVQTGSLSELRRDGQGVELRNRALWSFEDITGTSGFVPAGGPGTVEPIFWNFGTATLRKTSGGGVARLAGLLFQNDGVVECLEGTLQVENLRPVLEGQWVTGASTATINLAGEFSELAQPTFTGAGQSRFFSGSLRLFDSAPAGLDLVGGTVRLEPTFQNGAIQDLTLNGANLEGPVPLVVSGVLSMSGGSLPGGLTVQSGAQATLFNVTGAGGFLVSASAVLRLEAAAVTGTLTVGSGGTLELNRSLWFDLTVNNSGTVRQSGQPTVLQITGTGVVIQNGGVWELMGETSILPGGGGGGVPTIQPRWVNTGVLRKTAGGGTGRLAGLIFENLGSAQCLGGALQIEDLGNVLQGEWVAEAGTLINLAGNFTQVASPTFTGAGQARFFSGTLSIPASGVPVGLKLVGGLVTLDPGFQNGTIQDLTLDGATLEVSLPVTGQFKSTGGSLLGLMEVKDGGDATVINATTSQGFLVRSGAVLRLDGCAVSGEVTVAPGGRLELSGSALFGLTLQNFGTVLQNGQRTTLHSDPVGVLIQNRGRWELVTETLLVGGAGNGPTENRFVNEGLLIKTGGPGTGRLVSLIFENLGTVESQSGTIQIEDLGNVLQGQWEAAAGTLINLAGNFTQVASPTFTGAGQARFFSGTLSLPASGAPVGLKLLGGLVTLDPGFQNGTIQDLTLDGANLEVSLPVTGQFKATGGNLLGLLEVKDGGDATFINATSFQGFLVRSGAVLRLDGCVVAGEVTVAPSGRLELSRSSLTQVTLQNFGTVVQSGQTTGLVSGPVGVVIRNQGRWELSTGTSLIRNGGNGPIEPRFVNEGLLIKTGDSSFSRFAPGFFENRGTVEVQSAGGALQIEDFGSVLQGQWIAGPGTGIDLVGNYSELKPSLGFSGSGVSRFVSGTLLLPASGVPPGLVLAGGTVNLHPQFQGGAIQDLTLAGSSLGESLPVTGLLKMTGGSLVGPLQIAAGGRVEWQGVNALAEVTVEAGGLVQAFQSTVSQKFTIESGGRAEFTQGSFAAIEVNNAGEVVHRSGIIGVFFGTPGTVIRNSGVWTIEANHGMQVLGGSGNVGPRFINTGLLRRTAGDGQTFWNGLQLENAGDLELRRGRFTFNPAPVFAPSSRVRAVLGGSTSGTGYGVMQVVGTTALAGTLEVEFANGYLPQPEDLFRIIDYEQPGTEFTQFTGEADQFDRLYQPTGLTLRGRPGLAADRPLLITQQPVGGTFTVGSTVVLTTLATGSPAPTYQWRRNGQNLPGEDRTSLVLNITGPETGGVHTCVVANELGAVVTDEALIRVPALPLFFGDNFSARGRLPTASGVGVGINGGATREAGEPLHAGENGGTSVWIEYVAPVAGTLELSTEGSDFDTLLAVYTGASVGALTPVVADDDGAGFYASRVRLAVKSGESYAVAVDGRSGVTGNVVLRWIFDEAAAPPPRLVTAPRDALVNVGANVAFTVTAADTTAYQWFRDGVALVDGGRVSGATTPNLILAAVTLDDVATYRVELRGNGTLLGPVVALQVNPAVVQGVTLAQVGTFDKFSDLQDEQGNIFLPGRVAGPAAGRTPGEPASLARGVSGTQIFSTKGSAAEVGEPLICGVPGGASQWFAYLAEADGLLTLDTGGSTFDTLLAAYYDGCEDCDAETALRRLVALGCDAAGQVDRSSRVTLAVTNGFMYKICVDGVRGASGRARLNYRLRPLPPKVRAPAVVTGGKVEFRIEGKVGEMVQIESSTDLKTFVPVLTVPIPAGGLLFRDTLPEVETRVFRAVFP